MPFYVLVKWCVKNLFNLQEEKILADLKLSKTEQSINLNAVLRPKDFIEKK